MKNKQALGIVLLVLLGIMLFCPSGSARELASETVPVIINIPQFVQLNLGNDELIFAEEDFYNPELAETKADGILVTKSKVVSIASVGNIGYEIFISVATANFGGSSGSLIPANQLEWRLNIVDDDTQLWNPLSIERYFISARENPGEMVLDMDFRLLATWQDSPATYQGSIIITVIPRG